MKIHSKAVRHKWLVLHKPLALIDTHITQSQLQSTEFRLHIRVQRICLSY